MASLLRLPQALNKHTRRPSNLDAPADQAAPSVRYRYNVARLTPRYLAMSLAVCPSGLHPLRGSDVLRVVDLAGAPELGAVRSGGFTLKRAPLLDQRALELRHAG